MQAAYAGGVCGQEFGTLVGAAGVCDWLRDYGHGFGVDIGASTDEFALSTGWQVISSLLRVGEEVTGPTFVCCQAPVDGVLAGGRFGIRMEGRALQRREFGYGQELLSGRVVRGSIQGIDTVGVLWSSTTSKPLGISVNRSLIASSYSESSVRS